MLVNVYAPKRDIVDFLSNLFSILPDLDSLDLISEADLNCVSNPLQDSSSTNVTTIDLWSDWPLEIQIPNVQIVSSVFSCTPDIDYFVVAKSIGHNYK